MGRRIGGKDFDVMVGDYLVHVDQITLSITDNSGVAQDNGIPNGYVDGDVGAAGEMTLDTKNFNILIDVAKASGSWKQLPEFDCVFMAKAGDEEMRIEAFGIRFKISDLLDAEGKGGSKTVHKLPYDVTSPEFIKINGVPYLDSSDIENLG